MNNCQLLIDYFQLSNQKSVNLVPDSSQFAANAALTRNVSSRMASTSVVVFPFLGKTLLNKCGLPIIISVDKPFLSTLFNVVLKYGIKINK